MKDHIKSTPPLGNHLDAGSIIADIGAIHAIVEQHIACMDSKELGHHCNALTGVLILLKLLAAGIDAAGIIGGDNE